MKSAAPRVLIAKPGLDGHDRGARLVCRLLRDQGFDVQYTGIRKTPHDIAQQALEFRADAVGLSILSGAHLELVPAVIKALERAGLATVPLLAGGIIPPQDRSSLLEMGVSAIFGPGARSDDIVQALHRAVASTSRKGNSL